MSEIRVNRVVAADGSSAPQFPAGFSLATGMGITNSPNITGAAVTFSGLSQITNATDSTSSTTGSLVVTGGVGIAKNVYIGAGLSVAGTLTYEDVTSVDSVGLITAKSGVNVTGGQLQVGVAYSVGNAGVCTAAGFVGPLTGAATQITLADESSDTSCNVVFATAATGDLAPKTGTNLTFNSSTGNLTATQLTGTLQTATQSNITEVGTLGALTVSGAGEFKVGTAVTISSTAGVTTFSGDVVFDGATEDRTVTWDKSADALKFADSAELRIGNSDDLKLYHDGSNRIRSNVGALLIEGDGSANIALRPQVGENALIAVPNAEVKLYHNDNHRLSTTYEGVSITGFTSTSAGLGVTGGMWEGAFIKAGKLTDNKTIGISTSNIFVFTTQETTTGTPNIVWNDTYALSSKMKVGDAVTVTVITTAAAGGYAANWTIDGNAVSEQWNGGSAPSAGGSDGYDVYTLTLVRNGTGTGDSGWIVFANVSNFT